MAANANTLSHSFLEKNYVRDLVSLGVDKWKEEEEVWVRKILASDTLAYSMLLLGRESSRISRK